MIESLSVTEASLETEDGFTPSSRIGSGEALVGFPPLTAWGARLQGEGLDCVFPRQEAQEPSHAPPKSLKDSACFPASKGTTSSRRARGRMESRCVARILSAPASVARRSASTTAHNAMRVTGAMPSTFIALRREASSLIAGQGISSPSQASACWAAGAGRSAML